MFLRPQALRYLLPASKMSVATTQRAGLKNFPSPPKFGNIEYPARKKLQIMLKTPQYPPTMRAFKMQKRLRYMRGPEDLHTDFIHKQFGIIALGGGRLKHGHFEMIRNTLGRKMDVSRMFAIWRIDPPWQPVSKKGQGQRMGGGKGAIDHYVTPIKAERVIIEVGGECEYFEVQKILNQIAAQLPFKAMAVSYEELLEKRAEEERIDRENQNPWSMKYIIQNNIGGCHAWISPKDKLWFGKYR